MWGDRFGEKRGLVGRVETVCVCDMFSEKRGLLGGVQTECWVTGSVRREDCWVPSAVTCGLVLQVL